jgi:hypothetical protein
MRTGLTTMSYSGYRRRLIIRIEKGRLVAEWIKEENS